MNVLQVFLLALMLCTIGPCSFQQSAEPLLDVQSSIDRYISEVMETHEIPGLAIAVLKGDQSVYTGYFGAASIEDRSPVQEHTLLRIYSLTKIMTAIEVFRLMEEGHIELEDKAGALLDYLPEAWSDITIANLLSHSSGLPDVHVLLDQLSDDELSDQEFLSLLFDLDKQFGTGEDWSYNQTNYLLLKEIIELTNNAPFDQVILKNQFGMSTRGDVLFSTNTFERIPARAINYKYSLAQEKYEIKQENHGTRSYPLNGINIALNEYVGWTQRFLRGDFISKVTRSKMWERYDFKKSDRQFLYGWDVYPVNNIDSYGFSGGSVSGYRIFPDQDMTIIVLTNGYKYYSVQDIIINQVAGIVDEPLRDTEAALREEVFGRYLREYEDKDIELFYKAVLEDYP